MRKIKNGLNLLAEKLLRWCIAPTLRVKVLRMLGATIGENVRIYEVRFMNLEGGFKNFYIGNDVHIGVDCLFDLKGKVYIDSGSTLSPRVLVLTHQDPGSFQGSPLINEFPVMVRDTKIGKNCWVGSNSTLISGVVIGDEVVIAAGSVVCGDVASRQLIAGVPAVRKRGLS